MGKDKVSRELNYGGGRQVVPELVGLSAGAALSAATAAEVPVVAAGPGDDPRPLRAGQGVVVRQQPAGGDFLGTANWVMVWTGQDAPAG
ncbi:hypothetical protein [Amycolatopsis nigrescens]|uniref:hypothetical protein n=1 Tax=Amycolatopsis nigrescens TaxID=381445 RepID=UPI00035EEC52|nr:hypothetical protein [Amycolatopsis nigrescens]